MTLALAIAACLVLTAAVALWAARSGSGWRPVQTLLVTLAPLAALGWIVRRAPARDDAIGFRVVGQYAPLADTVALGGRGADVRVSAPGEPRARVWYDAATHAMRLRVDSGVAAMSFGGRPVNVVPLGDGARVTFANRVGLEIRASLPSWPAACLLRLETVCADRVLDVRHADGSTRRLRVRVTRAGIAAASLADPALRRAPFAIASIDRRAYLVASPSGPVRVNGAPVPAAASAPLDASELRIGAGSGAWTARVTADTVANRVAIEFTGRTRGERWPLAVGADRRVLRVAAGTDVGPGTLPVLDLDDAAPLGTRARAYAGALEWTGRAFRWNVDGRTRTLRANAIERLPGTGAPRLERGHLVQIVAPGGRVGALVSLALVWSAGALLLALASLGPSLVTASGAASGALRVAVLGAVYVLALVRVTLAYRVSADAPNTAEALPWAALFLAAFPLLVFLLERWRGAWGMARGARDAIDARAAGPLVRRLRPANATPAVLGLAAVVGAVAAASGPLGISGTHLLLGAVVVLTGTAGLALLGRVLVAREAGAFVDASPLGMLLPRAERGFGARQVWRAFTTLLVVLGLYVALAWSIRGVPSPLLAVAYAAGAALAYTYVRTRERVRPRLPVATLARWLALGAGAAAIASFLAASVAWPDAGVRVAILAALGGGAVTAALGWIALAPRTQALRGWPYREADVLPPPAFALLPALLIVVAGWTGLRRVAITVGYALAVAALLLVVRVFAAWWHRETGRRVRAQLGATSERPHAALLSGPLAVPLVVYLTYGVVDRGLLLLLVAAVLVAATIAAASVGRAALAVAATTVILVLGVVVPRAVSVDPAALGSRPVSLATPQMRYAALRAPDALAHQLALAKEPAGREIVATLQQDWGMRAHAANGGTRGGGLFSLPFGGAAISEDVALTDNAFAVWVLAEHGFVGAVAVLGAYLALALLLLGAARAAARRVATAHLALLLAGLAAYLILPALYMAAANVDLVPLTGQNFPLLGLRSGADVAFVAWLCALAVVALPNAPAQGEDDPEREDVRRADLRRIRGTVMAVAALVTVAAAGVGAAAWRATHADITPFALDTFGDDLRALVQRGDLVRQGDTIAVAPAAVGKAGLREGDLVRALVARSNAFARGAAAPRVQCLDRAPWLTLDGGGIRVNDTNCRIASMTPGERWRGALTAGASPARLLVAGLAVPVALGTDYATRALLRCDGVTGAIDTVRAAAIEVLCGDASVELQAGAPTTARASRGTATVNGLPLGAEPLPVGAGGVVSLASAPGVTLVIDSVPAGALGFARTRNGDVERVESADASPLVAALDSAVARAIVTPRAGVRADVALTLDLPLIRDVGARLARECAALGAGVVRRCSAIVVDPERGDVLALASWQRPGLARSSYEPVDANFRAHRPGSVIKPILASAVLARYPALAGLGVAQPADTFSVAAGWPLGGRPMHAARNGCTDAIITWRCFLPNSNNRFAVTLGLFGLAEEPARGELPALGTPAEGPPMTLDGRPLAQRPRLPARRPGAYVGSPLARNLATLFGVHPGRPTPGAFDESMWRPAKERGLVRGGAGWQRVSPAEPELPLDGREFADLRHVAGFMIGETDNRWSNAALARSVSRIATGRAVELRLVRRIGRDTLRAPSFEPLPFGPGREAVLEGMRGVVRGQGTARDVAALFASPALDLIGKTGTLESDALEPLSAFMWAGRATSVTAQAARLCPAAGIVVVELEPGAAERLRAATLFADAVAPALRETFGWGGTACARK